MDNHFTGATPLTEIIDDEIGCKWVIYQQDNGLYACIYYEWFSACGWRYVSRDENITAGALNYEFQTIIVPEQKGA